MSHIAYRDKSTGYWKIEVDGKKKMYHRWLWETHVGSIPEGMVVDHIDGDRDNNCLTNLRLATPTENNANRIVSDKTNIEIRGNSYMVRIECEGKRMNFGSYPSLKEAQVVRDKARIELFGEFAGRVV